MNPTGPSGPRSIGAFAFVGGLLMKQVLHGAGPAGYADRYAESVAFDILPPARVYGSLRIESDPLSMTKLLQLWAGQCVGRR